MASMSTWPTRERPRERLRSLGPEALGDSELLALVLGTGSNRENAVEVARRILEVSDGIQGLERLGAGALAKVPGVGNAKAARVVAAVEIGVRVVDRAGASKGSACFGCSLDIYRAYRARLALLRQEVFLVVGLNNRNEPIREIIVAQGSVNECRVEPREVFRPMIAEAATRVLLLHNHPSGDATPSPQDLALTRRLCRVGEIVGIPILDHLVVGRDAYSSMLDMGLLAPGRE